MGCEMVARMPMTVTTIISSINVNPPPPRRGGGGFTVPCSRFSVPCFRSRTARTGNREPRTGNGEELPGVIGGAVQGGGGAGRAEVEDVLVVADAGIGVVRVGPGDQLAVPDHGVPRDAAEDPGVQQLLQIQRVPGAIDADPGLEE